MPDDERSSPEDVPAERQPEQPDDTAELPADDDATGELPADRDATQQWPAERDATGGDPPGPPGPVEPSAGDTAALPAAGDEAGDEAAGAAWAGRAQVPEGTPGEPYGEEYAGPSTQEWAGPVAAPRRSWLLPVLMAVAAVLLLAVLGIGVWMIIQAFRDGSPVVPPASPSPTSSPSPEETDPPPPPREPPAPEAPPAPPPPEPPPEPPPPPPPEPPPPPSPEPPPPSPSPVPTNDPEVIERDWLGPLGRLTTAAGGGPP